MPDLVMERGIGGLVCGIDEAGRGPWAGPVVAAAVVLDPDALDEAVVAGLDDSKRLPKPARESAFAALAAGRAAGWARIGVAGASVAEIDRLNILQATFLAMRRAVAALGEAPGYALVDGGALPPLPCPARGVPRGDAQCASIAAASIVAKVTRDRIIADLDGRYPGYGFATNVGYGTPEHRAALARLGITPHHRKSFAPIHKILCGDRA